MFALDTNTLIYYFTGVGGVAARLRACPPSQIAIPIDTLIAGVALAHRATLVTNNQREFDRVPGLKLDNWI